MGTASLCDTVQRRRDPWAPFRIWTALTLALYALRASFATTFMGAIPGYVLVWMLLIAISLAVWALLFPGRVVPRREDDSGWWSDLREEWALWWRPRR
jgi:RsiW-degrading membrane proteinase PrsW (M82 family)